MGKYKQKLSKWLLTPLADSLAFLGKTTKETDQLKSDSHLPEKLLLLTSLKALLNWWKTSFISFQKALFVLQIFTFLTWPFGYVEKWLEEKAMTISKFMMSQAHIAQHLKK